MSEREAQAITSRDVGSLEAVLGRPQRLARVKFLVDTVHPDHGQVTAREVLEVTRDYVRDYEALGIAEETDEAVTRPPAEA